MGLSTIIGPDTYGIMNQYKNLYSEGLIKFISNKVNLSKYNDFCIEFEPIKSKIFHKYMQVIGIFMSTSRFYYNYRHSGNVFAVLSKYIKFGQLSNKYLSTILPETCACHPINTATGRIYIDSNVNLNYYEGEINKDESNIYYEDLIIKYNGHGLVKNHFRYIMTSRYPKQFPNSLKLYTQFPIGDEIGYNKFVYMTGHGGDSYLQFQAKDFISSVEMGVNFKEMYLKEPRMKILTLLDTCQASTMYSYIDKEIPLVWIASSVRGESSYSHNPNPYISISTCDKFTFVLSNFLNNVLSGIVDGTNKASVSRLSLRQLLRNYERNTEKERIEYGVSENIVGESGKKLDKVYLGQFIFNYRKLYSNSLKFKIKKNKNLNSKRFKNFKVENVKFQGYQNTSLIDKILQL
uniref:GPI anchor transamidase, putative n=1 Tax=Theileria annulata TaxID=5874 RepID=A0A3B0MSK5_THEAN